MYNKRIIGHLLIFVNILTFIITNNSFGQIYREDLPIPPHEIFENILKYNQKEEYEKIVKLLEVARPLIAAISHKFNKDLESEIRKSLSEKNSLKINKITYELILLDIKDLFDLGFGLINTSSANKEKANVRFKTAFLDYLILSPIMQKKDFQADQRIKNNFRKMVTTSMTPADGSKIITEIAEEINRNLLY